MYKLNKILWPTDGSDESLNALKFAKMMSKEFNANIKGYYVVTNLNYRKFNMLNMNINFDEFYNNEKNRANIIFNKVEKRLTKEKINFDYSFGFGNPAKEIVKYAEDNKIDIIVMGKRGIGLFDTNLTGSVTNKAIQSSSIPVLVSNPTIKRRRPNIKKILVPFNLNEDIISSIEYSVFLARKFNSTITIVYVEEYFTSTVEMPLHVLDDLRNYFNKKLDNLVNKYKKKGIKIDTKVIESVNTYLGILRQCESLKPDLIVMNTHGRKGLKKYFIGSIAEKIINDMPCPVLTLKA